MAASEALQSKQLAMFMPAKDLITASPLPGDRQYTRESRIDSSRPLELETDQQLWDRKLEESKIGWGGLHESIAEGGVYEPVRLIWNGAEGRESPTGSLPPGPTVAQGHHRIAAAHDVDPDMLVPVMHYENDDDLRTWRVIRASDPYEAYR